MLDIEGNGWFFGSCLFFPVTPLKVWGHETWFDRKAHGGLHPLHPEGWYFFAWYCWRNPERDHGTTKTTNKHTQKAPEINQAVGLTVHLVWMPYAAFKKQFWPGTQKLLGKSRTWDYGVHADVPWRQSGGKREDFKAFEHNSHWSLLSKESMVHFLLTNGFQNVLFDHLTAHIR